MKLVLASKKNKQKLERVLTAIDVYETVDMLITIGLCILLLTKNLSVLAGLISLFVLVVIRIVLIFVKSKIHNELFWQRCFYPKTDTKKGENNGK